MKMGRDDSWAVMLYFQIKFKKELLKLSTIPREKLTEFLVALEKQKGMDRQKGV